MRFRMNLGRLAIATRETRASEVFRLGILGDFSGRANRGLLEKGADLAERRPLIVDIDNLDDMLQRLEIQLQLDLGDADGVVGVDIRCMDDFHPDEIYDNLSVFESLSGIRQRLKNTSTFGGAAEELLNLTNQSKPGDSPGTRPKSTGTRIPRGKLSDFSRLIGQAPNAREISIEGLLQSVVGPHIQPAADPQQEALVSTVDSAIADTMRRVLHHEDFQTIESNWRSVDFLVRRLETGGNLQIVLYDVSAEELVADLSSTDDLSDTGLYQLLVERPRKDANTSELSAIIGNYVFDESPPHVELLARLAKISASANAPFLTAMAASSLKESRRQDVIDEAWAALQELPEAQYVGVVVPRFLLRWPYGAKTEPIDAFAFEEFTRQTGLRGMLWGNGAVVAGALLADTFLENGMSSMRLGSQLSVDDVPYYVYTDQHGDQVALPSTERLLDEEWALRLLSRGRMPLIWVRGRPEVRLGGFVSCAGNGLAGAWAPVEFGQFETAGQTSPPDPGEAPDVEATEPTPESATPAPPEPVANTPEEPAEQIPEPDADELDALLADLDDEESEQSSSTESDMDPDLEALLADL